MNQSIDKFLSEIDSHCKELLFSGCDMPLFRGHANGSWKLLPTIIRIQKERKLGERKLFELESALFHDFISISGIKAKKKDDWDILYKMRHHGVPTRLLDWSENLLVAIFFAIMDKPEEIYKPTIWILDPYKLNKKENSTLGYLVNPVLDAEKYFDNFCKKPDSKKKRANTIAIYPDRSSKRIKAQSGCFTIQGINLHSLEEYAPECLKRIDIPKQIISKLERLLILACVHKYTVYNDLDNLGKFVKEVNMA